ncbi:OmpA family protein [Desulfovibrio ferrophilus]|uniref:OmpA/MotB domain protein n=1 Tax=Desulfovibrio ferrophilus TaxID=241368 RepID=A0A2Z6AVU2_9BACT|nr:OmpA family protein [Desulfovibrio ferrophilus]BBD07338.1 OmpA/MotB domain protein [Desulfovibrio ferrophilus]
MSRMKCMFILAALAIGVVLMLGAGSAQAKLVPKVDGFVLFTDYSGSMAMRHEAEGVKKITLAKQVLLGMNEKIPALGYEAGMATFAPFEHKWQGKYGKTQIAEAAGSLSEDFPIFGRMTPMGDGFSALAPALEGMNGKVAVIIFSDGVSNEGMDPVAEATTLYQAARGRLCFHVVSFADTAAGQKILDDIAALSGCSVSASGPALLADGAAMDQFVRDVFYDEVADAAPAPVVMEKVDEVIELRIPFDFDSAKIRDDVMPILDEAAEMLMNADRPAILEGHTCNIGPDAYNQGLSERRAQSVKQYLVGKGVPAVRLGTSGMGESMPKYDNNNEEGRKLNRRVEVFLK